MNQPWGLSGPQFLWVYGAGFTRAGLAQIMGVTPGLVSWIERGEVSAVEALASYVSPRRSG